MPAMIVQGTADPLNNPALGETAVRQWLGTNGLDAVPSSTEDHGDPGAVEPGGGDPCVRPSRFPCAGGVAGWSSYPYTIHHHADADGCSLVDAWYVHGLSHDYPGGDPEPSFTDPIGPDITAAAWAFFQHHRVGRPCAA
jgi:poly(3-hydroxybutyrate) depolymerase